MNEDNSRPWTPAQRVGFRFLLSYLVLFFFPFPQGLVKPYWLGGFFDPVWGRLVPWFADVLHIELPASSSGSGDSTYEYVRILLMALIAAVATVVWSVMDRRRGDYRTLHAWARIWLRYALALCMLTYGVVKVVMLQFEPPGHGRLVQPLGEFSPMALLWIFMGSSTLYTSFTGVTEVIGGLLLFFRRTTTLGALVVAGVMTNVLVLNMAYDVCVKLGSMHILLVALMLLAPDAGRLINVLVLNRPTQPADLGPHWRGRALALACGAKVLVIVGALTYFTWDSIEAYQRQTGARDPAPVPPEGWYRVESMKRDGRPVPPLNPDELRWQAISLRNGILAVSGPDGSWRRYKTDGDLTRGPVNLLPLNDKGDLVPDAPAAGTLTLTLSSDGTTGTLTGVFGGHTVNAAVCRRNPADFPLMSRGFRWIIEEPYFR